MDDRTDIEPIYTWIRVSERLPPKNGFYICIFFTKPEMAEEGVSLGILSDEMDVMLGLCEFCSNGGLGEGYFDHEMVYFRVTHWIPFPPFPDKEEEKILEE